MAVLAAKMLYFIGRRIGKGSSLPGKIALKICPDVLNRIQMPEQVIAVTGSNGKTSTVEMLVHALRASGKTVGWNMEGANQTDGVATMLLRLCDLRGRVRCDVIVLESDERYARYTFRSVKPTCLVVTNLFRDQLTRNGHPEFIYECISGAIERDMHLILNADDPLCAALSSLAERCTWYGMAETPYSTKENRSVYNDGLYCPVCKETMEYSFYHYSHIGAYSCSACGHIRQQPDYCADTVDLAAGRMIINTKYDIPVAFRSIYNVSNTCAAFAAAVEAGADPEKTAEALGGYVLKNGRLLTYAFNGRNVSVLTSKHENSVSYDASIAYILQQKKPCTVVVLVDQISRKYFTGETSWLWDINFDVLEDPCVQSVVLAGDYKTDLSVRFTLSQVAGDKILVADDLDALPQLLRERTKGDIYVVTCFSDKQKFVGRTKREGGHSA